MSNSRRYRSILPIGKATSVANIWKGQFGPQVGQINDLAAIGAINLLFYLQEVILQDLVVLYKMFPSNPIWHHPVFQHEAYLPFAQKVETCLQQEEEGPSQLLILYQAVPAIVDCLCWKTSPQRYHVMRLMGDISWQEFDQLDNFDRQSKFLKISSTT